MAQYRTHTPSFRFRNPRPADLDTLLELERRSFTSDLLSRRQMRHWISATQRSFLICEDRAKRAIAGYALVFYRSNSTHARLYSIVVDKPFRGYGLARQLLARVEADARRRGCRSMRLEVSPKNKPAIGLYEALGYKRFGFYEEFYEDGGDALRLEKRL